MLFKIIIRENMKNFKKNFALVLVISILTQTMSDPESYANKSRPRSIVPGVLASMAVTSILFMAFCLVSKENQKKGNELQTLESTSQTPLKTPGVQRIEALRSQANQQTEEMRKRIEQLRNRLSEDCLSEDCLSVEISQLEETQRKLTRTLDETSRSTDISSSARGLEEIRDEVDELTARLHDFPYWRIEKDKVSEKLAFYVELLEEISDCMAKISEQNEKLKTVLANLNGSEQNFQIEEEREDTFKTTYFEPFDKLRSDSRRVIRGMYDEYSKVADVLVNIFIPGLGD
jgi:chromosome segregation ATPase